MNKTMRNKTMKTQIRLAAFGLVLGTAAIALQVLAQTHDASVVGPEQTGGNG